MPALGVAGDCPQPLGELGGGSTARTTDPDLVEEPLLLLGTRD
ncbi:MAG: hypothetical protein WKF47_11685 [Geodermatophilaceae bacterium]